MDTGLLSAAGTGVLLAAQFNPLASLAGAALGAALASRSERIRAALLALVVAWLLGDGWRIILRALDIIEGVSTPIAEGVAPAWLALALWALGGLVLGYLLPAWAGAFVGRRVTHGTGWLAAGMVAVAVSAALAALAARVPV